MFAWSIIIAQWVEIRHLFEVCSEAEKRVSNRFRRSRTVRPQPLATDLVLWDYSSGYNLLPCWPSVRVGERRKMTTVKYKEYDHEVLKRLQGAELKILLKVDEVCKKHHIPYFVDSGTALGAARHHGFIPWDDDIDIGLLRADYERFLSIAQNELGDEYVVSFPSANANQAALFGKIWLVDTKFETQETKDAHFPQGIFVDVVPYDVLSQNQRIAKKQISIARRWQIVSYIYHSPNLDVLLRRGSNAIIKASVKLLHHIFRMFLSQQSILRNLGKAIELGERDPSDNYVVLTNAVDPPYPISCLLPPSECLFEGHSFPVPHDLDHYLDLSYGSNWREMPPVEKRKNHAPLVLEFQDDR